VTTGTFGIKASSAVPPGLFDCGCAVDPPMNWWAILDRPSGTIRPSLCRVPTDELVATIDRTYGARPQTLASLASNCLPHIPEIDKASARA
jgi:hypothetical protein